MAGRTLPPGWPRQVPPPGSDLWEQAAVGWLLDQCPPEYRGYPVLRRHPAVLVRFTAWHVQAQESAARHGLAVARGQLRGVDPPVLDEAVQVLERELVRLQVVARGVRALEHAGGSSRGSSFGGGTASTA